MTGLVSTYLLDPVFRRVRRAAWSPSSSSPSPSSSAAASAPAGLDARPGALAAERQPLSHADCPRGGDASAAALESPELRAYTAVSTDGEDKYSHTHTHTHTHTLAHAPTSMHTGKPSGSPEHTPSPAGAVTARTDLDVVAAPSQCLSQERLILPVLIVARNSTAQRDAEEQHPKRSPTPMNESREDLLSGKDAPAADAGRTSGLADLAEPPLPRLESPHPLATTSAPHNPRAQIPDIELPDAPRDEEMAPGHSRSGLGRDIPRPPMSLRADSPSQVSHSLPADDGMRLLRERIHSIREASESQAEKARRMHTLMMERWNAAQIVVRPHSPASMISQERAPFAPSSPLSNITSPASPESTASLPLRVATVDPINPFNIQPEDLQPSYRPLSDTEASTPDESPEDGSYTEVPEPVLGCKHYKRNVKIQCFDCKEWHACRHCHDAAVSSHHLNRRATENMLCQHCWTPQAAAQYCRECGHRAAWYYCDICKLWDDDATKRIYHCPDCGICRRGEGLGKDFVHCKKCNVCISIQHYTTHTCLENATDSNCPLCLDYMFTSPLEIVAMPCGHYLHHHCYTSLMLSTYQCPICKRSAVNMETQWRKLEEEIRYQPMPLEWRDVKVEVKCNDCAALSVCQFHWLGVKCSRCDGFNTTQVRLLAAEEVRRDVQDFAEERRERRAEESANGLAPRFPRTVTAPVVVRPYFLDAETINSSSSGDRPRSARTALETFPLGNPFALPELLPPWPELSGRLPNLPQFRTRLPSMPNMPNMPSIPGMPSLPGLESIRHYFDDQISEGIPRQWRGRDRASTTEADGDDWRAEQAWFEDSEDEEDEEDEDEEDDEYSDEGESEGEDDEEEDGVEDQHMPNAEGSEMVKDVSMAPSTIAAAVPCSTPSCRSEPRP